MTVKRLNIKNYINARNYSHKESETRRKELEKPRQNFAQNSLKVNSPPIIYYQQIKNGFTCTCHATQPPTQAELDGIVDSNTVDPLLDVEQIHAVNEFNIDLKTPLFGGPSTGNETLDSDSDIFDDEEEVTVGDKPLFAELFAKGTDCGICYRTGFVPLWHPVGRQRIVLTTHHVKLLDGYDIDRLSQPHLFVRGRSKCYVEFELKIPRYFRGAFYGIFGNTKRTTTGRILDTETQQPITQSFFKTNAGKTVSISVVGADFTHVVIEFDFGLQIQANFPQLSVSRDFSQFFALQSVSIELPASISNPQVGDIVLVPKWGMMWNITSKNPFMDDMTLIKTSVEARVINTIETMANMAKLTELTDNDPPPLVEEFFTVINKVF